MTPWLGADVTFALLELESNDWGLPVPEWVSLIHVSDRELASDFPDDLLEYIEDGWYTEFEDGTYRGADIYVSDDQDIALGLTDEYLIAGNSGDSVEAMIRNLDEPPSRPLSEEPGFVSARETLPAGRVSFLYVNAEEIADILTEPGGPADAIILLEDMPNYIAASGSFVERGLRLDLVYDTPSDTFVLSGDNRLESRTLLPEDTLILLSTVGIQEI